MTQEFDRIDPDETAENAWIRLRGEGNTSLLVTRDDNLLGMLTNENLAEFLMIQAALQSGAPEKRKWVPQPEGEAA